MPYNLTEEQKSEIKGLYVSVRNAFDGFKNKTLPVLQNDAIEMQPEQLYCVVVSWILDKYRHVDFHKCNGLKIHKMASYFLYWFTRLKPIQILGVGEATSDPRIVLVNEIFAMRMACHMLEIEGSNTMSNKLYNEFIYMLRYRTFTAESLFSTMHLLEISAEKGALSPDTLSRQPD